jgi:hypothetical protein
MAEPSPASKVIKSVVPPRHPSEGDVWIRVAPPGKFRWLAGEWKSTTETTPEPGQPTALPGGPGTVKGAGVTYDPKKYKTVAAKWEGIAGGSGEEWTTEDEGMLLLGRAKIYAATTGISDTKAYAAAKSERENEQIQNYMAVTGKSEAEAAADLGYELPPQAETTPTDETGLDVGDGGGGGAAPMTAEEKELQAASVLMSLMAEKSTRQRASVEELGSILDKWIDVLKGSVGPEDVAMAERSARVAPGTFKPVEINLEPERQRALALGKDLGADMPELQRVLKQILPGFQGGGWSWNVPVTKQGIYGLLGETDPYADQWRANNLTDQQLLQEAYGEEVRPPLQQTWMESIGRIDPSIFGLPAEEAATQYAKGGGYQTEAGRQADLAAQTDKEIEQIRGQEAEDLAAINNAADEKLAQIDADTRIKVAQLQATGQQAQAQATIEAARQQAQAVIESAQIDAAARKEVTAMQEQGAKERLGAQLGMQWAETSQEMAANPRDYLALAFRQSGQGIPSSLQNYLQPAGGAVPTTKGAPAGIQDILSQYLGQ